ncbi:Alpha/Beta hydrolase protein [Aspergillus spectabilis]
MPVVVIRETIVSVGLIVVTVPTILASLLARRLLSDSELSFKEDLQRSFTRGNQLCNPVSNDLCKGTWICGAPGNETPQDPKKDPATTPLRISEIIESTGFILSIFSLDEAVAAYRYLLSLGFDPQRIVIAGQSAGGHLAISCLLRLAATGGGLPKPRSALLLYPWVNLANSSPSFGKNKHRDALDKRLLDRCVEAVGAKDGETGEGKLGLVDFTKPGPLGGDKNWKEILPAKTWVNVGSHDVFLHDIETFVASAEADGANIELQVTPRMGHGWQLGLDRTTEKEYCGLGSGEDVPKGIMRGSENIAKGLVKLLM